MAAGGKLYGPSNITLLLQNERLPSSSDVLNSLWPHTSNPTFPGSKSMGNCNTERVRGRGWRVEGVEKEEEEYEGWFHQQGKKRRLRREQVQFLEKNFEVENKLEPERKVQLAKELGLQPRQVAIWFQNRRARFKTKQLEKEYATLKASYDQLKADYETLVKENYRFKQEVNSLNNRLIGREGEKEKDDFHSSPNNINNDDDDAETEAEAEAQVVRTGMWKVQEDANSAKSDVLDNSEETEANHHSSWLEVDHSSELMSQEEEDNLSRDLLTLPCFPKDKVDHACYDHPPPHTCSNHIGLPPLEDHTFCFWPY